VIPGHGHLCDQAEVWSTGTVVAIVRAGVRAMVKKGMTLEQVKAAKLTRDYDPIYGHNSLLDSGHVHARPRTRASRSS